MVQAARPLLPKRSDREGGEEEVIPTLLDIILNSLPGCIVKHILVREIDVNNVDLCRLDAFACQKLGQ